MKRPNLLITVADDQRHSALGCCDAATADAVRTPHLDALAERGTRFSHAYHAGSLGGAVCLPSRAMLHSGCDRHAIPHELGGEASECPPLLGELLQDQGYCTHGIGKWHNGEASFKRSFARGSNVFFGGMSDVWNTPVREWDGQTLTQPMPTLEAHATNVFTESAVDFLQRYRAGEFGDRPFMLYVAYTAPHDPRQTYRYFHDRYPSAEVITPPNFLPQPAFDRSTHAVRDEMLAPTPRPEALVRQEISDYYAMVEHLDHGIGRVHAVLEELGLADETLVTHTADHGLAVGQHGLMGKQNLHDHSIRVPLIMAGPDVNRGYQADGLVYQHDLYPTLLEVSGANVPTHTPYRSLWPQLAGGKGGYDSVATFYSHTHRAATDGRRKLISYTSPMPEELHWFDLTTDPWETEWTTVSASTLSSDQRRLYDALPNLLSVEA